MGCIKNIDYYNFPKQADDNHKYPELGKRVKVCYHYDTNHYHYGTIVRSDIEEPFETIIKLDNGRYLRATECQYAELEKVTDYTNPNPFSEMIKNLLSKYKDNHLVLEELKDMGISINATDNE